MITFRAKAQNEADILIYGEIGESFWSEDTVTAKTFKKDLDAAGKDTKLNIYINSPGGNVFDAQAIYSQLKRHAAAKTVYIDGIAASAASLIAMAGDKIIMPKNSLMMIHRAWAHVAGNTADMLKMAETLEQIDGSMSEAYGAKSKLDREEIMAIMSAETWFTAEEAVAKGFADEIEESKQVAASLRGSLLNVNGQQFDLARFKGPPKLAFLPDENEQRKRKLALELEL